MVASSPRFQSLIEGGSDTGPLIEELVRSNAELQAFAHTVAHDLSEPLRTICAFTQLLVRRAQLNEADQEIARFIIDGARRMSTLVNNLLASSSSGFGDVLVPVDLGHAVRQATRNLSDAVAVSEAMITMNPLPTVAGDESDLVRLFQNLIGNAIKYRSDAAVTVHISAERVASDWVVKVRDNGIGIAKQHHHRVFGRFTRLHAAEIPGTGIGLAVCKRIVEAMNGTIWVESEAGEGAAFCFTVAAGEDQATPSNPGPIRVTEDHPGRPAPPIH